MKIAEYQERLKNLNKLKDTSGKPLAEKALEMTDIWSNDACLGYAAAALQMAGVSQDTYKHVMGFVADAMEFYTVDEAEKFARGGFKDEFFDE